MRVVSYLRQVMERIHVHQNWLDDPFAAVQREIEQFKMGRDCDAIMIDMHAEDSSEKMPMGHLVEETSSTR